MKTIALVTGASGGLGREFARLLCAEPVDEVWAVARGEQKLNALRGELGDKVVVLAMDLTQPEAIQKLAELLHQRGVRVQYLVNNAGLARMAPCQSFESTEISQTVTLNCTVPAQLCNICLPYMAPGSRILTLSSAASFQPMAYLALYAASKVFERYYTRALHLELKGTGITATTVCPGWVKTDLLWQTHDGKPVHYSGLAEAGPVAAKALRDAKRGRAMSVFGWYAAYLRLEAKLLPTGGIMAMWAHGAAPYVKE